MNDGDILGMYHQSNIFNANERKIYFESSNFVSKQYENIVFPIHFFNIISIMNE